MDKIRLLAPKSSQEVNRAEQRDILVVTNRPMVRALFYGLASEQSHYLDAQGPPLHIKSTTLSVNDIARQQFEGISLIVMDTMPDVEAAIQACQLLRSQHIEVPIIGLFCCPHHVELQQWRALTAAGVHSMIDMSAPLQNIFSILGRAVRGGSAISLQFQDDKGARFRSVMETTVARKYSEHDRALSKGAKELLELLASGATDQEIGDQLCLSPHTIKHRIERLRNQIGVKSRIELAAWAGYHGFYAAAS